MSSLPYPRRLAPCFYWVFLSLSWKKPNLGLERNGEILSRRFQSEENCGSSILKWLWLITHSLPGWRLASALDPRRLDEPSDLRLEVPLALGRSRLGDAVGGRRDGFACPVCRSTAIFLQVPSASSFVSCDLRKALTNTRLEGKNEDTFLLFSPHLVQVEFLWLFRRADVCTAAWFPALQPLPSRVKLASLYVPLYLHSHSAWPTEHGGTLTCRAVMFPSIGSSSRVPLRRCPFHTSQGFARVPEKRFPSPGWWASSLAMLIGTLEIFDLCWRVNGSLGKGLRGREHPPPPQWEPRGPRPAAGSAHTQQGGVGARGRSACDGHTALRRDVPSPGAAAWAQPARSNPDPLPGGTFFSDREGLLGGRAVPARGEGNRPLPCGWSQWGHGTALSGFLWRIWHLVCSS